jgi:hypothetical protein
MNREDESPTDPTFEPESPEAWERLDGIERRLKAARPRPPRLDVAALERLARQPVADPAVQGPAAGVVFPRPPTRRRPLYRRIAAVAGSWACGAAVGALVTVILMTRTAPGTDSTSETSRIERQTPTPAIDDQNAAPRADHKADRRDGPAPAEKVEARDVDAVLAMILNGPADSARWPEGRPLRAGMHLIHSAGEPSSADPATDAAGSPRGDHEGWRSEALKGPKPYPAPAPAITRERLLREVLSETPGVVL